MKEGEDGGTGEKKQESKKLRRAYIWMTNHCIPRGRIFPSISIRCSLAGLLFSSCSAASSCPHLASNLSCSLPARVFSDIMPHGRQCLRCCNGDPRIQIVDLFLFLLIFSAPHLHPRALLALHDNALPMVSIPRPLPPFCVPPLFL